MTIQRRIPCRKTIFEIGVLILLGGCIFGCAKKENPTPAAKVSAPSQGLPELAQNKIFLTNRPADPEPPDYSYRDTHDGLDPPPEGMENLPAGD